MVPGIIGLLLLPMIWDGLRLVLRRRGDRSSARRAEVLRHFTEEDIDTGRAQVLRHNRLFPISRALFYGFFAVLLFAGGGYRLETTILGLDMVGGSWVLALPFFLLVLLTAWILVHLPVAAYRELVIQRQAGLSTISARVWLVDTFKSLLVGWILATLAAYPVVWLIGQFPRIWPLPAAAAVITISAFTIWISPWLIAPLFNRFSQLTDPRLVTAVQEIAEKAGLPVKRVLVMDASRRSTYLNAYFTGLGNSRRVVLFDTLLEACEHNPGEILSVVAHELGHFTRRHILKSFILQSLGAVAGLWLLKLLFDLPAFCDLLKVPSTGNLTFIVALPFLGSLGGTLVAPLAAAISRRFERQADLVALELTGDPEAFVSLQLKLTRRAQADLLRPPLLHWWYSTHPLPEERICAAESFRNGLSGRRV
jgi:STE24 endopeptidase